MTWATERTKIRRFLRDPDGSIWTNEALLHIYNDVQKDLQQRTSMLEEIHIQRVPGLYHVSYLYDWEWRNLPSQYSRFYQCLEQHDNGVFCHRWEPQQVTGISTDVTDYGVHFTHPWEAFMGQTPAKEVPIQYPANFGSMKFVAYDKKPLIFEDRKRIQSANPSHITEEGEPIAYYQHEEVNNSFVLYPRPSTAFVDEIDGEGIAFYAEDDSEDATTGQVATRTGGTPTDTSGVSIDLVDTTNNVFMAYTVNPTDVTLLSDTGDFPLFAQKYIRFGVLSRAYGANTDGRIRSLSEYWQIRYEAGVKMITRFRSARRQDRDYRMTTKGLRYQRGRRHPRLPSEYPAA
tara:strand:+ start:3136 stop:4173 length:1038 start_codon:yes stop_codon:yes gene_type:complete